MSCPFSEQIASSCLSDTKQSTSGAFLLLNRFNSL